MKGKKHLGTALCVAVAAAALLGAASVSFAADVLKLKIGHVVTETGGEHLELSAWASDQIVSDNPDVSVDNVTEDK